MAIITTSKKLNIYERDSSEIGQNGDGWNGPTIRLDGWGIGPRRDTSRPGWIAWIAKSGTTNTSCIAPTSKRGGIATTTLGAANTATSTTEIDGPGRIWLGKAGEQVACGNRAVKEKGPGFSSKPLIDLVARDGIEPSTRGFSVRCSTN